MYTSVYICIHLYTYIYIYIKIEIDRYIDIYGGKILTHEKFLAKKFKLEVDMTMEQNLPILPLLHQVSVEKGSSMECGAKLREFVNVTGQCGEDRRS